MKRSTRFIIAVLTVGGVTLSCDDGRLLTDVEQQPFQSELEAVAGPDTLFVGEQATYSTTVRVGDDEVTADVIDWGADPPAVLTFDTTNHTSSLQVEGAVPGQATLTATTDHPSLTEEQADHDLVVLLLDVEAVTPATGDTTIAALGETFVVRARGIGDQGASADSSGLTWTHAGSALSVTSPLDGRDALSVESVAAGTDTLSARQGQSLCVQGDCVATIVVRVAPTVARVEADDSVRFNAIGTTRTLSATAYDSNDNALGNVTVSWALVDPADSTVIELAGDSATSRANGSAAIVATVSGAADTTHVVVRQVAETLSISPGTIGDTLVGGDQVQLNAAAADSNGMAIADTSLTWSSTDVDVATVTSAGLVTAQETAELDSATVVAASGPESDSVRIFVGPVTLTSVRVTPPADSIGSLNGTKSLLAQGLNQNGNPIPGQRFTWASRNTGAVTVTATTDSTARATGVAEGQAYVVATSTADATLSDSALVAVDQIVDSVALTPAVDTFTAHSQTRSFTARGFDALGSYVPDAVFSFSDDLQGLISVAATSDTTADVTSESNGTAELYATETATSNLADTARITVTQVPDSIVVTPADTTISAGSSAPLSADVFDANGALISDPSVDWRVLTADTAIASVSSTGVVTGRSPGTARVVANPSGDGTLADTSQVTVVAYTLAFDGDDYATAGTALNLDATTEPEGFTLEAWVYTTSGTGDEYILSKGGVPADKNSASYGLFLRDGKPAVFVRDGSGNPNAVDSLIAGSPISTSAWHHVGVTFDNTNQTATLYVDGSSVASATLGGSPINSTNTVYVGASSTTPDNALTGRLDELRVWSGVRTATEIGNTYQSVLNGTETGLRAYWSFDAGSGNPADLTGNGNLMTLAGSPNDPTYNQEFPSIP